MEIKEILALIGEAVTIIGLIASYVISIGKFMNGQRCLLRSEMLRIYYNNKDRGEIRQYMLENFLMLYEAYKKIHGNSFIDKINEEIKKWKVIT